MDRPAKIMIVDDDIGIEILFYNKSGKKPHRVDMVIEFAIGREHKSH